MIARREGFDFVKARMLVALGKDESANEMGLAGIERHKAHPYLKRHARLLRDDRHRPAGLHHLCKLLVDMEDMRLAAGKQFLQAEFSAGVPLVGGREFLAAARALPKRSRRGKAFACWQFGHLHSSKQKQ